VPVAGVELGAAAAHIRKPDRLDLLSSSSLKVQGGGHLHAQPLLRRAGAVAREHLNHRSPIRALW
jgi:hypothetical protein